MGSGKSTLGRALGAATGLQFIDLDNYIERRFHANVRDIFASRGETGFRDIERRMLCEVSTFENVIVACGGGTPCFFDNMEIMNRTGTTVLLSASRSILIERLKRGRNRRPLIATLTDEELTEYIDRTISQRMPYYSMAAYDFCSDLLDCREDIERSVLSFTKQFIDNQEKTALLNTAT